MSPKVRFSSALNLTRRSTSRPPATCAVRGRQRVAGGNRKGYAGYELNPGLAYSIWHVRNRVLTSDLGLWTRRDPAELRGFNNRYAYAAARPIVAVDSQGLFHTFVKTVSLTLRPEGCTPALSATAKFDEFIRIMPNEIHNEMKAWIVRKVHWFGAHTVCFTGQRKVTDETWYEASPITLKPAVEAWNKPLWGDESTISPTDTSDPSWSEPMLSEGGIASEAWIRVFGDVSVDPPDGANWSDTLPGGPSGMGSGGMRFRRGQPGFWNMVSHEGYDYHKLTWSCCTCDNMFTTATPPIETASQSNVRWNAIDGCTPPSCELP